MGAEEEWKFLLHDLVLEALGSPAAKCKVSAVCFPGTTLGHRAGKDSNPSQQRGAAQSLACVWL